MVVARTFIAMAVACLSLLSVVSRSSARASSALPSLALKRSLTRALGAKSNWKCINANCFVVQVTSSSEDAPTNSSKQLEEVIVDPMTKWSNVDNKSTIAIYAGGALVTLWLSSTIIGAINFVPLLPKLLELIGLGYTGWFVYRYLLFKSSQKELKGKITGATSNITRPDQQI